MRKLRVGKLKYWLAESLQRGLDLIADLAFLHRFVEVLQTMFGVGEEHHGFLGVVEEGVVDAGEAWAK